MREGGGQGEIEREPNSSQNKPNITAIADRSYLILADKIQSHIHLFPRIKEECTFLFKVNINSSIYYPWDCTIFCDFTKKKKVLRHIRMCFILLVILLVSFSDPWSWYIIHLVVTFSPVHKIQCYT